MPESAERIDELNEASAEECAAIARIVDEAAGRVRAAAHFEFALKPQIDPTRQPVEGPRIVWDEAEAPFFPVAHIEIPPPRFDTPERKSFGENLSFTPWHCKPEHRRIGGINRVQLAVYERISSKRHEINHRPREEPRGDGGASRKDA